MWPFVLYDRFRDAAGDALTARSVLALGQDSIEALCTSRSKADHLINGALARVDHISAKGRFLAHRILSTNIQLTHRCGLSVELGTRMTHSPVTHWREFGISGF